MLLHHGKLSGVLELIEDNFRLSVEHHHHHSTAMCARVTKHWRRGRGRVRTSAVPAKSGWRRLWLRGNDFIARPLRSVGLRGRVVWERCIHYTRCASIWMLRQLVVVSVVVNPCTVTHGRTGTNARMHTPLYTLTYKRTHTHPLSLTHSHTSKPVILRAAIIIIR